MTERTYKCSANPRIINKNEGGSTAAFASAFQDFEFTNQELQQVVQRGIAISYQYGNERRVSNNFICTDIICVDIDGGKRIDEALAEPLVRDHALFIYTTCSHTPELNRYRIIYGLLETQTDSLKVKAISTALAMRLCGDMRAVDASRISYGSRDCKIYSIDNHLTPELIDSLIAQGIEQIEHPKSTGFAGGSKATSKSRRFLSPTDLVTKRDGAVIAIGSIKKNTTVYCPDHFDNNPSAFVGISQTNGKPFLRCRVCLTTRWVGNENTPYNFNSFEEAVRNISQRADYETVMEDTPFGAAAKTILKGGNIFLSSTDKLQIDRLRKGIMFVKSPKGSGKTTILPEILAPLITSIKAGTLSFEEFEEQSDEDSAPLRFDGETAYSVLLIGHRRALIREMCQRIGLRCYLDDEDRKDYASTVNERERNINNQKRYGICLDSLPKLVRQHYDLVIIDESEQVLSHFMSQTMANKREHIFQRFKNLLRSSRNIICLDADLTWITFNTICELGNARSKDIAIKTEQKKKRKSSASITEDDSKAVSVYINSFKKKDQSVELYNSKAQLIGDMLKSLECDSKIYVTSNSKGLINEFSVIIKEKLPSKRTICVTSDNSATTSIQKFITNIKAELPSYDAVLASPSLSTGIDITFPNEEKLVDVVYGFFENQVTHHFEIDQQLARVRHPKAIKVWISPRSFFLETDIATVKDDILTDNLLANTYLGVDSVTFEDIYNGEDQLLRLASMVASQSRASINQLRANFVRYKQDQGVEILVAEPQDELLSSGKEMLRLGKAKVNERAIESIMKASYLDQTQFLLILESQESNLEVTQEMRHSYIKSKIEYFFRQRICKADIVLSLHGSQGKIKLLESIFRLNLDREPVDHFDEIKLEKDKAIIKRIEERHPSLSSISDDRVKPILLHLILQTTPIYKGGHFIVDHEFTLEDLVLFKKFIRRYKSIIECQLGPIRSDLSEKPTRQLGDLLRTIDLKLVKARTDQKNKVKKYMYTIDKVMLKVVNEIIDRRKVHTDKEYSLIYWKYVHEHNGYTTPLYDTFVEYVGDKSYSQKYWAPIGGKPFNNDLKKSKRAYDRLQRG